MPTISPKNRNYFFPKQIKHTIFKKKFKNLNLSYKKKNYHWQNFLTIE